MEKTFSLYVQYEGEKHCTKLREGLTAQETCDILKLYMPSLNLPDVEWSFKIVQD